MPTFTDITTASLAVDKPITSAMMTALRDNALAAVWHPYNKSTIGDANTGLVYDHAVTGAVANVETPTFEDGYEYRIILRGVSHSSGSDQSLSISLYAATSASYVLAGLISTATAGTPNTISGFIELSSVRASIRAHPIFAAVGFADGTPPFTAPVSAVCDVTTAQQVSKARINFASGNFDAGQVYLYRRGVFAV